MDPDDIIEENWPWTPVCRNKHKKEVKKRMPSTPRWKTYTNDDLINWATLLMKRATHRTNKEKIAEDLKDAQAYLTMLKDKLAAEATH